MEDNNKITPDTPHLKLSDRQAGDIREKMGRIMTCIDLIKKGKPTTDSGDCRYQIIRETAESVDNIMCSL